jgi:uncharacterized Ntn-hydrolase superfamily protein
MKAPCFIIAMVTLAMAVGLAGSATPACAGIPTGTFSIVAYDSTTGELGVAVQSRAFSVGSSVAWAEAGVGAIATQATTNQAFGPMGLELLRQGLDSKTVLERLLAGDEGRENRQVGIIDASGKAVNFTGSRCLAWAGGTTGADYACQGNILVSEDVVAAMAGAFERTPGELARRLLAALAAAQAAGGDRRGMQSAALLVVRPSDDHPEYRHRYVDLRVDDHADPINELVRLYGILERSRLLEAHLQYAEHYEVRGRDDLAARERGIVGDMLKQAVADSTSDAEYLNNLAWFCATQDLFLPVALEAAKRAVALQPDAPHILDTLAEVYFRMGQPARALETIDTAIRLDPESPYYKEQKQRFQRGK